MHDNPRNLRPWPDRAATSQWPPEEPAPQHCASEQRSLLPWNKNICTIQNREAILRMMVLKSKCSHQQSWHPRLHTAATGLVQKLSGQKATISSDTIALIWAEVMINQIDLPWFFLLCFLLLYSVQGKVRFGPVLGLDWTLQIFYVLQRRHVSGLRSKQWFRDFVSIVGFGTFDASSAMAALCCVYLE